MSLSYIIYHRPTALLSILTYCPTILLSLVYYMSYCFMSYTIHGIVLLYTIIQTELKLKESFRGDFCADETDCFIPYTCTRNIINKIFTYM